MNQRILAALAILAAATAQGCDTGASCNDCGPCGFAGGPNETDEIWIDGKGQNPEGIAVVELALVKQGACAREGADHFWLQWDAGNVTLVEAPADGTVDSTMVAYDGESYSWKDRDLVVSFEGAVTERVFTFAGETTVVVTCAIAGGTIACSPS